MKKIVLYILFCHSFLTLAAQELKAFRNTVEDSYNFWYYTPEGYKSDTETKPLIIFLHGRSLCGNDLARVRRYGPLNAIERGMRLDAMVLAPQNPGGSWRPSKVFSLMEWAKRNYRVDTSRIYVMGMSLGGYGTIDFVGTYPDRVAAAMALCGGGTIKELCGLADVPLWIMHGTADRAVGIKASQRVVEAIRGCAVGDRLIWTPLNGLNHGRLARVFYLPETYQWLLSHSLADSNRTVNRTVSVTPERINGNIYRELQKKGKEKISVVDNGGERNGKRKTENGELRRGNGELKKERYASQANGELSAEN